MAHCVAAAVRIDAEAAVLIQDELEDEGVVQNENDDVVDVDQTESVAELEIENVVVAVQNANLGSVHLVIAPGMFVLNFSPLSNCFP